MSSLRPSKKARISVNNLATVVFATKYSAAKDGALPVSCLRSSTLHASGIREQHRRYFGPSVTSFLGCCQYSSVLCSPPTFGKYLWCGSSPTPIPKGSKYQSQVHLPKTVLETRSRHDIGTWTSRENDHAHAALLLRPWTTN